MSLTRAESPFPLGASTAGVGTHFSVHAPDADRVQLCLVEGSGEVRIDLEQQTYGLWYGIVDGVGAGQRYGYRVGGRWDPRRGYRMNLHKLLIDPYARQLAGELGDADALLGYADDPFGAPSDIDSLGHVPLSVVTAQLPAYDGPRLETPWEDTVIQELHVGAFTARHPDVRPEYRGTYLGLASEPVVEHFRRLGVTAVELLPVQAFLTEPAVRARGMRNHWGYSTGAYFAPHARYATTPGREIPEFRAMVDALHAAGIEVILDVVYNHTCEFGIAGPTLSWRGFDAPGYYQLTDDGADIDLTGCGNTVDCYSPVVVGMVCDSLRYWATDMGVDGFRFDLTPALARDAGGPFDPRAPLLTAITTDPILQRRKLIAEPWDATKAGYQVGNFGPLWSEWNDRYRDDVRRFWIGDTGIRQFAWRIAGSADIFHRRTPLASINFVTAHDGFTMADLVSYADKNNDANGENSNDGAGHNFSVNHGVEGPTDDAGVIEARARHVRALLATLLLSTGVPMLLAGDELGHSQSGNNNAYCVPVDAAAADAWAVDWPSADEALISFVARLTDLRRSAPALRQPEFFEGRATPTGHPDLVWFGGDGIELDHHGWHDDSRTTLQAWIDGSDVRTGGVPGSDASWLLVFHSAAATEVTLAGPDWFAGKITPAFDSTTAEGLPADVTPTKPGSTIAVTGPSVLAFRAPNPGRNPDTNGMKS